MSNSGAYQARKIATHASFNANYLSHHFQHLIVLVRVHLYVTLDKNTPQRIENS